MASFYEQMNLIRANNMEELRHHFPQNSNHRNEKLLAYAVNKHQTDMVRTLLTNGTYPNALEWQPWESDDDHGVRAKDEAHPTGQAVFPRERVLHRAYANRDMEIVKELLQAGANILMTSPRTHQNIVEQALQTDDVHMLNVLADHVTKIVVPQQSQPLFDSLTSLASALASARPDPTNLHRYVLADDWTGLEQHAPHATGLYRGVPAKDKALAWAVHLRKEKMVEILLGNGAYANAPRLRHVYDYVKPRDGILNRDPRAEEKEFFRHHDSQQITYDDTFHNDHDRVLHEAYENRDIGIMKLLLRHGAVSVLIREYVDGSERPDTVSIVLHAVEQGDKEMIQLFLQYGQLDLNNYAFGLQRVTPLMHACLGMPDMMQFLIDHGADVNQQTHMALEMETGDLPGLKRTCVHTCIKKGNREGLQILMKAGVDINVYDGRGFSAWACAVEDYEYDRRGKWKTSQDELDERAGILEDILEYNVNFSLPDQVQLEEEERPIHDDVDEGESPMEWDRYPTPRALTAMLRHYRRLQSVEYLTTLHATVLEEQDRWGKTALHRAAENAQVNAVHILLAKGARVDILDAWQRTPLMAAQSRHDLYLAQLQWRDPLHWQGYTYRWEEGNAAVAELLPKFQVVMGDIWAHTQATVPSHEVSFMQSIAPVRSFADRLYFTMVSMNPSKQREIELMFDYFITHPTLHHIEVHHILVETLGEDFVYQAWNEARDRMASDEVARMRTQTTTRQGIPPPTQAKRPSSVTARVLESTMLRIHPDKEREIKNAFEYLKNNPGLSKMEKDRFLRDSLGTRNVRHAGIVAQAEMD